MFSQLWSFPFRKSLVSYEPLISWFSISGLLVFTCVFLSGCATLDNLNWSGADEVTYRVTSTPNGATIVVNGENKGVTPMQLTLEAKKKWAGILVAPGGWSYVDNFYFIRAEPTDNNKDVYAQDFVYLNPRNIDSPGEIHFALKKKSESTPGGIATILGNEQSFLGSVLPAMASKGYTGMLEINGKPLHNWNATPYEAKLPAGEYAIAARCTWIVGMGYREFKNVSSLKIKVEADKTYRLAARQASGGQCQVAAQQQE
jgi:hypothetical protein